MRSSPPAAASFLRSLLICTSTLRSKAARGTPQGLSAQRLLVDHLARLGQQHLQHAELRPGELQRVAVVGGTARRRVQPGRAHFQLRATGVLAWAPGAAQHRAQPGGELARVTGFWAGSRRLPVPARRCGRYPRRGRSARDNGVVQNRRNWRSTSSPLHAGQHDVQHDGVVVPAATVRQSRGAIVEGAGRETFQLQKLDEQGAQLAVVVNDQYGRAHRLSWARGGSRGQLS